jgi:hypothetical protein
MRSFSWDYAWKPTSLMGSTRRITGAGSSLGGGTGEQMPICAEELWASSPAYMSLFDMLYLYDAYIFTCMLYPARID